MKKSDLSVEQLDRRKNFVKILEDGGWKSTSTNRVFDKDRDIRVAASMTHENKAMQLTTSFDPIQNVVFLGIFGHDGYGLDLIIEASGCFDELLKILVMFKDDVTSDNYKNYVRQMIKICPRIDTLIETDSGEKRVPVLDDQLD